MIGRYNPFNIRYVSGNHWLMSDGQTRGFVNFKSLDYGVRAACILVMRSYRRLGVLTISEIIHRFAPSSENDTDKYVDFVCFRLDCFPFDIPSRNDFPLLLESMSLYEGNPVPKDFISKVIDKFSISPYKCK